MPGLYISDLEDVGLFEGPKFVASCHLYYAEYTMSLGFFVVSLPYIPSGGMTQAVTNGGSIQLYDQMLGNLTLVQMNTS